ncbi:GNAT family N-acetyltransferase [Seonamhaeicola algicola]|uniref:GNAT family N-acetyltransferase n=1 Tax=Seonamhaeicola algicola TaxID=1719036 RepID=A0A5C7ASX5_9FLAO|nr:GNAT family N-acetyltransferase [Seonamhaeicola algicola]TXE11826.1 GNAT family N-acetyltransferase [Seonamhaeicola algicola]
MITISIAKTNQDFETIATLADTIWREHYIPIIGLAQVDYMLEKFQSAAAIKSQVTNHYMYYLLEYNKKPVGYISIKKEDTILFLSKIYVLSSCRGKKIGKTAMNFIEDKAKKFNLKAIRLTVNVDNENSIKAYEALGFINKRSVVADIGNGFVMDDYEMVKTII